MAYDTYANLQLEIIDWLHRADLAAKVPGFIALAEAKINRKLNIVPKEIDLALVMTIGSRFITKPAGMGQPIAVWNEYSQPREHLTQAAPESMTISSTGRGMPKYWAIDGANLAFDKAADLAYPLTFRYIKDGNLSDASPTSELLTRAPDLYLFGALAEAAPYIRDDMRAGEWRNTFNGLLRAVHVEYTRNKSGAPLMTDVPTSTLHRYDWRNL